MKQGIVPWQDWREWERVYASFFESNSLEQKRWATERVNIWKSRGNNVPVVVIASAHFICVQLDDNCSEQQEKEKEEKEKEKEEEEGQGIDRREDAIDDAAANGRKRSIDTSVTKSAKRQRCKNGQKDAVGNRSSGLIRLAYSSALVRCVNGVLDAYQDGAVSTSLAAVARRIGMPEALISMRHDVTHGDLPSLATLRIAAGVALQWMLAVYWRPQHLLIDRLRRRCARYAKRLLRNAPSAPARAPDTVVARELLISTLFDRVLPLLAEPLALKLVRLLLADMPDALQPLFLALVDATGGAVRQLLLAHLFARPASFGANIGHQLLRLPLRLARIHCTGTQISADAQLAHVALVRRQRTRTQNDLARPPVAADADDRSDSDPSPLWLPIDDWPRAPLGRLPADVRLPRTHRSCTRQATMTPTDETRTSVVSFRGFSNSPSFSEFSPKLLFD
jgi:Las1-like